MLISSRRIGGTSRGGQTWKRLPRHSAGSRHDELWKTASFSRISMSFYCFQYGRTVQHMVPTQEQKWLKTQSGCSTVYKLCTFPWPPRSFPPTGADIPPKRSGTRRQEQVCRLSLCYVEISKQSTKRQQFHPKQNFLTVEQEARNTTVAAWRQNNRFMFKERKGNKAQMNDFRMGSSFKKAGKKQQEEVWSKKIPHDPPFPRVRNVLKVKKPKNFCKLSLDPGSSKGSWFQGRVHALEPGTN